MNESAAELQKDVQITEIGGSAGGDLAQGAGEGVGSEFLAKLSAIEDKSIPLTSEAYIDLVKAFEDSRPADSNPVIWGMRAQTLKEALSKIPEPEKRIGLFEEWKKMYGGH